MALSHKIKILLEFGWNSNTIYRLYPPFLYKLAESVFENTDYYYDFDKIEFHYSSLVRDQTIINHTEFSILRNQSNKTLGEFARKALHQPIELFKLYKLLKYKPSFNILELGSCLGLSTLTMCLSSPLAKITSIEGNLQFIEIANELVKKYPNVKLKNQLFDEYLSNLGTEKYDFIIIDGDHSYEATMKIMNTLKHHLSANCLILLDDIHWSSGMVRAWNEIKNWKEFKCSLETLRWGLLFSDNRLTPGMFTLIPSKFKIWQKYF